MTHAHETATALHWTQDPNQLFARFAPDLPKDAPKNIMLPVLEKLNPDSERRRFSQSEGFVPVDKVTARYIERLHVNGEPPERGGKGPLLFQVLPGREAARITQEEQRQALLQRAGGSIQHTELRQYLEAQQHEQLSELRLAVSASEQRAARAESIAEQTQFELGGLRNDIGQLTAMLMRALGGGAGLGTGQVQPAQEHEPARRESVAANKPEERSSGAGNTIVASAATPLSPAAEEVRRVSESKTPMSMEEARSNGLTEADGTVLDFAELARGSS
ncbi:hypothetical protein EKK58_05675 [Candidatus Dependentiae bacterium]|nr:MAG: hypothetical protein EKK58_05675 [Candidatus Dependentiae bacterium]